MKPKTPKIKTPKIKTTKKKSKPKLKPKPKRIKADKTPSTFPYAEEEHDDDEWMIDNDINENDHYD